MDGHSPFGVGARGRGKKKLRRRPFSESDEYEVALVRSKMRLAHNDVYQRVGVFSGAVMLMSRSALTCQSRPFFLSCTRLPVTKQQWGTLSGRLAANDEPRGSASQPSSPASQPASQPGGPAQQRLEDEGPAAAGQGVPTVDLAAWAANNLLLLVRLDSQTAPAQDGTGQDKR